MEQAMKATHTNINFASPESLELMCLSILHFLLHILLHIRKIGYRWKIKKWNSKPSRLTEDEKDLEKREIKRIDDALGARGLTIGNFPGAVTFLVAFNLVVECSYPYKSGVNLDAQKMIQCLYVYRWKHYTASL